MTNPAHKKHDFIGRSILSALAFLKDATLSEEYANRKGFLQSLDPRFKTISFLLFLVTVVSLKSTVLISPFYLLCLILALLSGIPLRNFLLRASPDNTFVPPEHIDCIGYFTDYMQVMRSCNNGLSPLVGIDNKINNVPDSQGIEPCRWFIE